jgi:hypothetical protein
VSLNREAVDQTYVDIENYLIFKLVFKRQEFAVMVLGYVGLPLARLFE